MSDEFEVIVIGAGPVGLFAACSWVGHVKTLVVERRPDLSRHPKAMMGGSPRTMNSPQRLSSAA